MLYPSGYKTQEGLYKFFSGMKKDHDTENVEGCKNGRSLSLIAYKGNTSRIPVRNLGEQFNPQGCEGSTLEMLAKMLQEIFSLQGFQQKAPGVIEQSMGIFSASISNQSHVSRKQGASGMYANASHYGKNLNSIPLAFRDPGSNKSHSFSNSIEQGLGICAMTSHCGKNFNTIPLVFKDPGSKDSHSFANAIQERSGIYDGVSHFGMNLNAIPLAFREVGGNKSHSSITTLEQDSEIYPMVPQCETNLNTSSFVFREPGNNGSLLLGNAVEQECQFSKAERKQNWCFEPRPRENNAIVDKFYYHMASNKRFRSEIEVYNFIEYGICPKSHSKGKEKDATPTIGIKRVRGGLIIRTIVGYYLAKPQGLMYRFPPAIKAGDSQAISNVERANKLAKTGQGSSTPRGENSEVIAWNYPGVPLYDFETVRRNIPSATQLKDWIVK